MSMNILNLLRCDAHAAEMHQAMIRRYHEVEEQLREAVDVAKNAQEAFTMKEIEEITTKLSDAITSAQRVGMDEELIQRGQQFSKLLDVLHRLERQSGELEGCSPVKSQRSEEHTSELQS